MNQLQKYNEFESQIQAIEDACNFIPDVSTKDGYEKSKRIGIDGRKVEKAIDTKRLELRKEAMKTADEIHEAGKALCERIAAAYKPHQEAYKAHDAEIKRIEQEKEQAITDAIDKIREIPHQAFGKSSHEIGDLILELESVNIEYGKRTIEAGKARNDAIEKLSVMKAEAIAREVEQEELERQRAEIEKQQEEARKAQAIIDEANRIEQEKQDAERAKLEEEKRKQEEAERIRKAEIAAQEAERKRIEQEAEAKRIEEEKRAANLAHRKKVNNAAKKDFANSGFSDEDSQRIVELIAQGKISNIAINY